MATGASALDGAARDHDGGAMPRPATPSDVPTGACAGPWRGGRGEIPRCGPTPRGGLRIAHRAGNDLAALREAEGLGVDLVEADVHLFHGRVEVRHLKTVGPIPLLWDRWRLGNPFAPRLPLEELIAHAGPETELMLDLKGHDRRLARLALAAVRRSGGGPVTICARRWALLDGLRGEPEIRLVYSAGSRRQLRALLARLDPADGPEGVSVHERLLDPDVVAALRERVAVVMSWGARDWARVEALRDMGVNGIISDDRALLRRLAGDAEAPPGGPR